MFCAATRGTVTEFNYQSSTHPSLSGISLVRFVGRFDSADGGEGPESENGQDLNPYPLEGKYINEADRQTYVLLHIRVTIANTQTSSRLLTMPEIEREGILEQRLEEMQRFQDARNLDQMVKAQKGGEAEVSKVPKRARLVFWMPGCCDLLARITGSQAARGWNKEKTQKLDEYRAKRLAKGDKMKVRQ